MRRPAHPFRRAFSLIELVIVVSIIGIIALIAVPRMSRGSDGAREAALTQNLSVLNEAAQYYAAEHEGLSPAHKGGSVDSDSANLIERLTSRTDADGTTNVTGIFGPYLRAFPVNPINKLRSVRILSGSGKTLVAAGSDGWIFYADTLEFASDAITGTGTGGGGGGGGGTGGGGVGGKGVGGGTLTLEPL